MPLQEAISSNLIPFVGLAFLLFIVRANPLFDRKQTTLFTIAIIVNLVLLVSISADFLLARAGNEGIAWVFRRFTSFLSFAAGPIIPFLLFGIYRKGRYRPWHFVLIVANVAICFASMFFNLVFLIGTDNSYDRGPLFFAPFLISVGYIALIILQPSSSHARQQRVERIFLLGVIALLVLGLTLEVGFRYRFMSWNCSAIGIISYYLLLNMHYSTLDSLTGIYSRAVYTKRLASFERTPARIIALADINDFKDINDQLGHDAGDECLVSFAAILTRCFAGVATPYRIGGDEFALVAENDDSAAFERCLAAAHQEAKACNFEFACGYAIHYAGEDISKKVDQAMYEEKKRMKDQSERAVQPA
ncbi:MAG: GGDEF domain-containing protein [Gordonibacter sp.]|uniref:GGDEF domain-containing protein n=1 Tax=Gordonibacter sp. TaxID=1968902 RepID=UPI002FC644D0